MLARTFFVRRRRQNEAGEWETDEEGEIGEVVSEHVFPIPEPESPTGYKLAPLLGVIWDDASMPAITYEDPIQLENVDSAFSDEDEEDYEEAEEEDFFEAPENLEEAPQNPS